MPKPILPVAVLTAALVLPLAPVSAQQSTTGQSTTSSQSGTSSQRETFQNAAHASDIIGKKAYSTSGETVGSVNDLLIGTNGRVEAAVIDVGGMLGMGQHTVAVDWNQLRVNPGNDRVTVAMTKDELRAAPEYKKSAKANGTTRGEQTGQTPESGSRSSPGNR